MNPELGVRPMGLTPFALHQFDAHGDAHAAADAQRGQALLGATRAPRVAMPRPSSARDAAAVALWQSRFSVGSLVIVGSSRGVVDAGGHELGIRLVRRGSE